MMKIQVSAGRTLAYCLMYLTVVVLSSLAIYNVAHRGITTSSSLSTSLTSISNSNRNRKLNYAITTFLTAPTDGSPSSSSSSSSEDHYFTATRLLAYQLLHDPVTRSREGISFVVMVTPEVAWWKRAQLAREGALVFEVPHVESEWIRPGAARWRDMMTKLRVFTLTQWDRVLFIDADGFVLRNIDGIFEDPAVKVEVNLHRNSRHQHGDNYGHGHDHGQAAINHQVSAAVAATEPSDYVLAGNSGSGGLHHSIPPLKIRFLNGGFFLFRPSTELFEHYMAVANDTGSFDAIEAEQALLNHVHSWEGNMPWKQLDWRWNINWPTWQDYEEAGYATLHTKYWDEESNDPRLLEVLLQGKRKMEEYWEKYGP